MSEAEASKLKTMAEEQAMPMTISQTKQMKRRRRCLICIGALLLLLLILITVSVILAFTVFKPKEPRTQLVSASLEGIAPRISFPVIDIQFNVTLGLKILVENRNHASFKQQQGKSILQYKGQQIGDTDIYPGLIPARGSTTLSSRLTLQLDKLASDAPTLITDIMAGQVSMESASRIPGKVSFLGGIIKKHIVAKSHCQFNISIPDMKIQSQVCKNKAKL